VSKSRNYVRLKLGRIRNTGWAVGSSFPKTAGRHSDFIQLGCNVVNRPWHDKLHLHTHSEEWYVVLKGKLIIEVNGRELGIGPREILGVRANVPHRVIGGRGPIEEFSLRMPSVEDKKLVEPAKRKSRRE
jgi:mannose-6-phosphate isomerase-like protein (cupin superfamily)